MKLEAGQYLGGGRCCYRVLSLHYALNGVEVVSPVLYGQVAGTPVWVGRALSCRPAAVASSVNGRLQQLRIRASSLLRTGRYAGSFQRA